MFILFKQLSFKMSSTYDEIEEALPHISASCGRNEWVAIGMAIKSELGDAGFGLWDNWSSRGSNYNKQDAKNAWRSFDSSGGITIGTLFHKAKEGGYKPKSQRNYPLPALIKAEQQIGGSEEDPQKTEKTDRIAVLAKAVWRKASSVKSHSYLEKKGVQPHGIRVILADDCPIVFWATNKSKNFVKLTGELLLIPLYNIKGELRGLEAISTEGLKSFPKGLVKSGLFMPLSGEERILPEYDGIVYVVEGIATAATVRETEQKPTIMGIDAGTLKSVAEAWRKRCPEAQIVIVGDFDESEVGQKAAEDAARAIGGTFTLPEFTPEELEARNLDNKRIHSDYNDLYQLRGFDAVRACLAKIIMPTKKNVDGIILTRAADIKVEPIQWLWDGWLAKGKFHILAGAPGTGKTTIAMAFASIVAEGGCWPLGYGRLSQPQSVLIWTGEDDLADTLVPRLIAHGADLKKIHFIEGIRENGKYLSFDPATDIDVLSAEAKKIGSIGLIIVDPVSSAVSGDSNTNSDVRRNLQPLVDLGFALNTAVLGITHLTKGTVGRDPLERVTGSIAFTAMPRLVLIAAKVEVGGIERRMLARIKSNIGPDDGGFYYDFTHHKLLGHEGVTASRINWMGSVEGSALELLAEGSVRNQGSSSLEEAENFVTLTLKHGPMPSTELKQLAKNSGIAERTLERARQKLGIKSYRDGNETGSLWKCRLPESDLHPILPRHR